MIVSASRADLIYPWDSCHSEEGGRANVSFDLARRVVVITLCLTGATNAFAQGGTGTLTGTVVDSSGAAIPGATITATEVNTGTERMAVSDDVGVFRMAALNP